MILLLAFAASLLAQTVPLLVGFSLRREWRRQPFLLFPVALALDVAFYGALAAIAVRAFPPTAPRFFLVTFLAPAFALGALRVLERLKAVPRRFPLRGKHLALVALVALVANVDSLAIFGKQGWDFDTSGRLFQGPTYFRAPLNDDIERDVILVNALNRDHTSPFVPGAPLVYQFHWHSATALLTPFFPRVTELPVIEGAIVATACLLTFLFLWAICVLRPALFLSTIGVSLGFLFLAHADLYSFLYSLFVHHRPGLEADWSVDPYFFRNFSLKLIGLTSPQHANFFCLLLPWLAFRGRRRGRERGDWLEGLTLALGIVVSPVLAAFFFLPFQCFETLRRTLERRAFPIGFVAKRILAVALGAGLFHLCLGFPAAVLFHRDGVKGPELFSLPPALILASPILWISALGVAGIVLTAWLAVALWRRDWRRLWRPEACLLVAGAIVFYYVVTTEEVRRHFAIVAAVLGPCFLMRVLPGRLVLAEYRPALFSLVALAALLHGYFIYSYVGKPSYQNPDMPWRDYFAMNTLIEKKYPGLAVLGAMSPKQLGLQYPPLLEVTRSFSLPIHALVHTRVNASQLASIERADFAGNLLPYAFDLGFQAVLWGPVEERVWGEPVRRRFLREERWLATCGSVKLYRLSDNLKKQMMHELKGRRATSEDHLRFGKRFEESGWNEEALVELSAALVERPDWPEALDAIGVMLGRIKNYGAAEGRFRHAIELAPEWGLPRLHLAMLLAEQRDWSGAEMEYRALLARSPKDAEPFERFAVLLTKEGRAAEALPLLESAERLAPGRPSVMLARAQALSRLGRREEASVFYRRILRGDAETVIKAQAHLELGDGSFTRGETTAALAHYGAASDLAPLSAEPHLRRGYALGVLGYASLAEKEWREATRLQPNSAAGKLAESLLKNGLSSAPSERSSMAEL